MARTTPPPAPPRLTPAKTAAVPPAKSAAAKPATAPAAPTPAAQMLRPPVEPLPNPHERKLGHGVEHGMKPITFPDPAKIHSFHDLTKAMKETTAGARDLGEAAEVLRAMVQDKDCFRVLTLSGNATPFTTLIAELIDRKIFHAVVSTGSIVTHTFSAERGRPMFKIEDPDAVDDNALYGAGYNRIYDIIELEESLNEGFDLLREITDSLASGGTPVGSADITRHLGRMLNERHPKQKGLLHAAERNDVPIFIPAFTDCEVGLDFWAQNAIRTKDGRPTVMYDGFKDWAEYAALIKEHKDSCGILTLGGGVTRNWAQQVGPSFDILTEYKVEPKDLIMRFRYGVRICTAPSFEGGLSGCSYSEGRSWGKFWPPAEEGGDETEGKVGMTAEITADYSVAFPLLCAVLLEGK